MRTNLPPFKLPEIGFLERISAYLIPALPERSCKLGKLVMQFGDLTEEYGKWVGRLAL
jgi:hypothetical protein